MRIWGITGTNGKTTTAWVLSEFLGAAYITTVEVNTLKRRFYSGYTTPPKEMLKSIYAEMEEAGAKDCVMEVSSHAIAQDRVGFNALTRFSGGAFTNISEDHLDYHGTMEEYFRVKLEFARRIAEGAGASGGSAGRRDFPPFAIAMDGAGSREMLEEAGKLPLNVIPVSIASPRFDLSRLRLAGDYNKSNVLVAATLAESAGVPKEEIERKIPLLRPRWGRLEEVPSASKARVFVDFAHTPDGLVNVMKAARTWTKNRLFVVFGAGGDRDRKKRPLMGEAALSLSDVAIVTSDNPRSEDPMSIISDIVAGNAGRFTILPSRREAIEFAVRNSGEGDTVLVCGKGHEKTQEIAGVKHPFDDAEVIRSTI